MATLGGNRMLGKLHLSMKSATVIVAVLSVLAVGAGAAAGTVLQGDIQGAVPISVSQALVVDKPQPYNFPPDRSFFGSTSDDRTKFAIALEMYRGESLMVLVPIVNRSSGAAVAEFSVIVPNVPSLVEGVPGLSLQVSGSGVIDDVVRVTSDTWTFTADAGTNGVGSTPGDGILLTFTVAPTAMSGYFEISGRIRTVEF
ncbi:MAG: hypothetical protein HYY01_00940 [Chloroflexi bacterium]|nr:hypothetical protein [Chloroflexota bacterium]